MRNFMIGFVLAVGCLVGGVVVAATLQQPSLPLLGEDFSSAVKRPCIHPTGGWTEIDCSAAAAYSAQLNQWDRYVVQAIGGAPYFAVTTAGSGQDADSSDGYIPEGNWYEFITTGTNQWISCNGSADGSKLRYFECQ